MTTTRRLRELMAKATPGPWYVATGCSWRRILGKNDEPAIVPEVHPRDGWPDLSFGGKPNDELAVKALNALPRLLAVVEAAHGHITHMHTSGCGCPVCAAIRALDCEGCRRHALDPRWTLRFWARESPCSPRHVGRWMHVDPSGSTYDCTAPGAEVPDDDE